MIDWKRVTELRDEIGANEFNEVVELFLEEVDGVIERLKTDPDPDNFEEDLHFLKGCAANLGYAKLAGLCLTGETCAAKGATHNVDLAQIFECFEQSKTAFFRGLPDWIAA